MSPRVSDAAAPVNQDQLRDALESFLRRGGRSEAVVHGLKQLSGGASCRVYAFDLSAPGRGEPQALVLRLETADGRFVAESRAAGGSDPRIDVALPADGGYRLTVSDAVHGNGADHPYEIRVSSAPRLAFVFPPAAAPGTTIDAVAWGW